MDYSYLVLPFFTWFVAGSLKFAVNFFKGKKTAFQNIGYGGFPSNHSAIVSSMVVLIGLKDGSDNSAFGVALTLAFIVMLDANSLRREVGRQAVAINHLAISVYNIRRTELRERMGHSIVEILGGVLVGSLSAIIVYNFIG